MEVPAVVPGLPEVVVAVRQRAFQHNLLSAWYK